MINEFSIKNLLKYIEEIQNNLSKNSYAGYDPYDALNSPLFVLPILKSNKLLRFGFQQVFRRIPINLRPLLGIKKEVNPVTLGLAIQAFTYLSQVYAEKKELYQEQIDYCLNKLEELKSNAYSGYCWGYNFDWEARYTKINKYVPTVVATGIITNGLYENYRLLDNEKSREMLLSASKFVLNDLNKYESDEGSCYSYSPVDNQLVFNASLKGARLLAQVYSITKDESLKIEIINNVKYVVSKQRENGSWAYSEGDARTWSDNYHTGYVLDCLEEINKHIKVENVNHALEKGFTFYKDNFFLKDGTPKYYNNKTYPIDSTSGAQSILTLTRFGELKKAKRIIEWMLTSMYDNSGYFYYQKMKFYKHKTSYPRWSTSWMFVALAYYLYRSYDA